MLDWLTGKKTYFVLGTAAIVWLLESLGIIPQGSLDNVIPPLTLAGGATVADKLNRMIN
jgi:hypothetical protein